MRLRRIVAIAGTLVVLALAGATAAVASGHGQSARPAPGITVPISTPHAAPSAANAVLAQDYEYGITEITDNLPAGVLSAAYGHGHVTPDAVTGVQRAAFVYGTSAAAEAAAQRFQAQVDSAGMNGLLIVRADGSAVTVFGDDSHFAQFLDQFGIPADQKLPGD